MMPNSLTVTGAMRGDRWFGVVPPQYVLANRRFERVVLDPPDLEPGSWVGAGNVLLDHAGRTFWLCARWKRASERGFSWDSCILILRSPDGESFEPAVELHRSRLAELFEDDSIRGAEGLQLLKDPRTGRYHLYASLHREGRGWDTGLLVADSPAGPWQAAGTVIPLGDDFDALDARDATISVIDGRYLALYKAASGRRLDGWEGAPGAGGAARINVALATSADGIRWTKRGPMTLDGRPQPEMMLLSGALVASSSGPMFLGIDNRHILDGITCGDTFAAYLVDPRANDLQTVYRERWEPLSPFERRDYPIHSYLDLVVDPFRDRLLLYVEAIDPGRTTAIGIDTEVDRLLLYSVPLRP